MVRSRGLSVSEASSSEAASFYFDRPLPRMTNSNFEALKGPFPANDNFQELEAEWRVEHELWKLDQDTPVYPARRQDICGRSDAKDMVGGVGSTTDVRH